GLDTELLEERGDDAVLVLEERYEQVLGGQAGISPVARDPLGAIDRFLGFDGERIRSHGVPCLFESANAEGSDGERLAPGRFPGPRSRGCLSIKAATRVAGRGPRSAGWPFLPSKMPRPGGDGAARPLGSPLCHVCLRCPRIARADAGPPTRLRPSWG